MNSHETSQRKFWRVLLAIAFIGLGVRLTYTFTAKWDQQVWGDQFFYHQQAELLLDGQGFSSYEPQALIAESQRAAARGEPMNLEGLPTEPTADHPPLFAIFLAGVAWVGRNLLGGKDWSDQGIFRLQILADCLLGTGTVIICGLAGRTIGSERVGLISAAIAAGYANLWIHDPVVMSETIAIFMVGLSVLALYRWWKIPTSKNALILGIIGGIAALTRAEVLLFLPLGFLPVALKKYSLASRERLAQVAIVAVASAVVISPWVARNMTRFERPLYLSGGAEITMASSTCDLTWYDDEWLGWWNIRCTQFEDALDGQGAQVPIPYPQGDVSERGAVWRERAVDYYGTHQKRIPVVMSARLGRMWEVYRPFQKLRLDYYEGRNYQAAWIALIQFWVLVPLGMYGTVILRRARVPIIPFVALGAIVSLAAVLAFGATRYRAPFEVAIVLCAAAGIDAIWSRAKARA